jgi:hypothetical protein
MTWFVGDPCYIIPDDDWTEFCELTLTGVGGDRMEGGHIDSVIQWRGQEITLWTNGGDGVWEFDGLRTLNGENSFWVDAGIYCKIDLEKLAGHYDCDPSRHGMIFADEPDFYTADGVVYLNDRPDKTVMPCPGCDSMIEETDEEWCDNGMCGGCYRCFECECWEDEEE